MCVRERESEKASESVCVPNLPLRATAPRWTAPRSSDPRTCFLPTSLVALQSFCLCGYVYYMFGHNSDMFGYGNDIFRCSTVTYCYSKKQYRASHHRYMTCLGTVLTWFCTVQSRIGTVNTHIQSTPLLQSTPLHHRVTAPCIGAVNTRMYRCRKHPCGSSYHVSVQLNTRTATLQGDGPAVDRNLTCLGTVMTCFGTVRSCIGT